MSLYTVQVYTRRPDDSEWDTWGPAETIDSEGSVDDVAEDVAARQEAHGGGRWLVRAWEGEGADTGTTVAAERETGTLVADLEGERSEDAGGDAGGQGDVGTQAPGSGVGDPPGVPGGSPPLPAGFEPAAPEGDSGREPAPGH